MKTETYIILFCFFSHTYVDILAFFNKNNNYVHCKIIVIQKLPLYVKEIFLFKVVRGFSSYEDTTKKNIHFD